MRGSRTHGDVDSRKSPQLSPRHPCRDGVALPHHRCCRSVTVHPIRITGDPVLHTPASPVTTFDSELHALVQDLVDTMHAAPGVGLAAPQIGVGLQVFVWEWEDDDGVLHAGSIVNPKMTTARRKRGKLDPDADAEGCLSAPDLRYPTRRSHSVVLQGFTPDQVPFHQEASGWLARIFQHEFDHLRGTPVP